MSSPFAPLRVPAFRAVWLGNLLTNFGGLIQAVGAAWLMTEIAASDTQVALVQASTTLPVMAFSLLSGAIADNLDRRRVMLFAQFGMFVASAVLVIMTLLDAINAWSLLALTFLIGCGVAFNNPSWQASVRDLVGMELLPRAVLLNGVGFNVTRSVAPALGGVIVATWGAMVAFAVNTVSYLGIIYALWRWRSPQQDEQRLRESLGEAIRAGVRYAWLASNLRRIYVRSLFFGFGAITVLALLPLIVRDLLAGDSVTFGLLLGGFGVGAVVSGLTSENLRERLSSEQMVRLAFVVLMAAIYLFSISTSVLLSLVAALLSGWAWVLALALLNTTVQLSTPRWVVGRAMAFYQMFAFGGMALGSWVWGTSVDTVALAPTLQLSVAALGLGLLIGIFWPLPSQQDLDLDPLNRWVEPDMQLSIEPRSGPVSVSIEYSISAEDVPEFVFLMAERRRIRRRDGAHQWSLARDLADSDLWLERFEFTTWADYVRFHARTTQEDAKVHDRVRDLHRGGDRPQIKRRLIRDPADKRISRQV